MYTIVSTTWTRKHKIKLQFVWTTGNAKKIYNIHNTLRFGDP